MERLTPELKELLFDLRDHDDQWHYLRDREKDKPFMEAHHDWMMIRELKHLLLVIPIDNKHDIIDYPDAPPEYGDCKLKFPLYVHVTSRGRHYRSERITDGFLWIIQALLTAVLCAIATLLFVS